MPECEHADKSWDHNFFECMNKGKCGDKVVAYPGFVICARSPIMAEHIIKDVKTARAPVVKELSRIR